MMVVSFDEISFYQRYSVFTNTVIFVNKTTIISGFIWFCIIIWRFDHFSCDHDNWSEDNEKRDKSANNSCFIKCSNRENLRY